MRRWNAYICMLAFLFLTVGCGAGGHGNPSVSTAEPDAGDGYSGTTHEETEAGLTGGMEENMEQFTMESGKAVYLYVPQAVKEQAKVRVPMVLFLCGTNCDPVDNAVQSGWLEKAEEKSFIVISPDYNNYATYGETEFLSSVVEYMIQDYPVDPERIYSTGFSNGGAASVALTRDYPEYFAAISAMGWMVDMDNKNGIYEAYDMPFQVVQGDGEFTEETLSGGMAVMDDEKKGVRALFLYNEMIDTSVEPDYDKAPYWGYVPDETETAVLNGREWRFDNFYKDGYPVPFAQLVIAEDREHRPRKEEAGIAWDFFRHFRRDQDGKIVVSENE